MLKIGIDLTVIGTEVNQDGKFVLTLMFEGKRQELIIIGVDLNEEWIFTNGKGSEHKDRGAGQTDKKD